MNRFYVRLSNIPFVAIVLFLAFSASVLGQVTYTVTGTLNLQSGKDPLKLNGKQVTATAQLDPAASPTSTSTTTSSSTNTYTGPPVSLTVVGLPSLNCDATVTVTLTDNVTGSDTININNCNIAGLATLTAAVTIPPGNLITALPSALRSTAVTGSVTAQLSGASPTDFTLTGAAIVAAGNPPPTVSANPVTLTAAQGSTTPVSQPIAFTAPPSSAAVSFTASATGAAWLSVSPSAANTTGTVTVSANPAGLAAGTYNGTVVLSYGTSGVAPTQIPVTFTITGVAVSLTAAPTSLTFNFTPGSSTQPSPQTLTISSASATSVSAAVTTGNSWLSVSPATGTTPASFTVSVNTTGITSGSLSGNIQITASGAASSPLNVPVTLSVSSTTLTVPTTPLTFTYAVGGATPAAQSVSITGTAGISFTTSTGGVPWLSATPSGTVPSSISVSINAAGLSGLAAGSYNGAVTVTANGAGGSPATIPVTLTVSTATLTATPSKLTFNYQIGSSTPPAAQTISIGDASNISFTVTAATNLGGSWLSVTPGSGNTSGALSVSVNPKGLTANFYTGTITIAGAGATSQVVNVSLVSIEPGITGIVSGASYDNSGFSPGTIVTIFGNRLGPQTGAVFGVDSAGGIAENLGGTTVTVEGAPAIPLFAQNGQINMILPYTLNTSGQAYVEVKYNDSTSVQYNIPLVPADVQIFTADANGSGPGSILNQDFSVNSAGNPAARGSVVSVFGTGGGAVKPAVKAGAIAGNTLSWITLPYSATVNGETAKVLYAGSAPGLVFGVYQFNVQLPADVATGAAKIVLKVGDSASQPDVTVFVK
jgi:uncharacterized protein (TIGR03437 family)